MCGFTGIYRRHGSSVSQDVLISMIKTLNHRGPDNQNIWADGNIGLAHARLSIHDLSEAGRQPMASVSGRWVIAFNGEIYNFKKIKGELRNCNIIFKGNSDTEVLVNAIEIWGIEATLKKCIGMFAFVVWDKKEKLLYLARDRFGEKPLYYGSLNNDFIFGSELKPFKQAYSSVLEIDRNALATYMRFGYVPTPSSIYKNIFKLEAGTFAIIDQNFSIKKTAYWRAQDTLVSGASFQGSYDDAVDQLENKLKQTLELQMCSDVPLGAFLSGGVDSSAIVALMQSMSQEKIKTFSIGFSEKQYNEAEYARAVAKHLETEHTDMYVSKKDALAVIPELPRMYDEPFADSSQIPTYLVSKIAKSKVTVSLSGDAGDELFGGYNRYLLANAVKKNILDKPCRQFGFSHIPASLLKLMGRLPSKYSLLSDKLLKLQSVLQHSKASEIDLYKNLCSQIYSPNQLVLNGSEHDCYKQRGLCNLSLSYQKWMMFADSQTYMTDDILTKVDRAAMAVSLETRVPFLDHRIFEFAWSLPMKYKIHNGVGKRVLRDVLYKYVPRLLIDRPKMGFGVPLGQWLKTDLKEWAEELLNISKIKQQGYLNAELVRKYWSEHQAGKRDWQYALWNILMFQAWLEEF